MQELLVNRHGSEGWFHSNKLERGQHGLQNWITHTTSSKYSSPARRLADTVKVTDTFRDIRDAETIGPIGGTKVTSTT